MGGREHRGYARPLPPGQERGPGRSGGVHDRRDVVGPLLKGRHPRDPVGKTGAALVEQDQPAHGPEPVKEPGELRELPHHLQVRHPARDKDQVQLGRWASYLIRDIDVAGPGKPRLRNPRHTETLTPAGPRARAHRSAPVHTPWINVHLPRITTDERRPAREQRRSCPAGHMARAAAGIFMWFPQVRQLAFTGDWSAAVAPMAAAWGRPRAPSPGG